MSFLLYSIIRFVEQVLDGGTISDHVNKVTTLGTIMPQYGMVLIPDQLCVLCQTIVLLGSRLFIQFNSNLALGFHLQRLVRIPQYVPF